MRSLQNKLSVLFITCLLSYIVFSKFATASDGDLISVFPLDNYSQNLQDWMHPSDNDYDKPLISKDVQQKRYDILYDHYFGDLSPWNAQYVNEILQPHEIKSIEADLVNNYSNAGKSGKELGYGENFRAYPTEWTDKIRENIQLNQFDNLTYQAEKRAITIDNLQVRVLPTDDVHFFSYKLPGQGYPFDNLQMSAMWAGTPVYVTGTTRDSAWSLVITPDYIGWVKSSGLAYVNQSFVSTWLNASKIKLAAITRTNLPIQTSNQFLFSAYVGSIFPAEKSESGLRLMVPAANADRQAVIRYANVSADQAAFMPLAITKHNIADIMRTLLNRPYGWGGMYFYNDCSAELKSLFTAFGIYLPRHSSDQVLVNKMVDMSASSPEERLAYLMKNGKDFITIIYIGGHVVLYIGSYANPHGSDHDTMAMTYQNMWGLSPTPANRRAVVGQAVLIPMLLQFPEDTSLTSQAAKKYFQVAYLDQLPGDLTGLMHQNLDIKSMMMPDTL